MNSSEKLEDQPWYYGTLPRKEINTHLKENGQFLVRASEKKGKVQLVISVCHEGKPAHFPMIRDRQGWKLEEEAFETIPQLIRHYRRNRIPLTKQTPAIIKTPIRKLDWMLDSRDVRIDKKLGGGQFGNVHSGKMRLPGEKTWIHVAVKRCTKTQNMSDSEKQEFLREAKLMLNYQHENVVKMYGVAVNRPPIMIIMELCPGGALDRFLKSKNGNVPVSEKLRFCLEAAKGMEYLSKKKCIHRDLAARNCLLGTRAEVKIGDFGMSRQGKYEIIGQEDRKIPLRWTAPESLREGKFTTESDIYSYGILTWEIFADGIQPWPDLQEKKKIFQCVISGKTQEPPECTPPVMKRLMLSTWNMNPSERPSFTQIKHSVEETLNQL